MTRFQIHVNGRLHAVLNALAAVTGKRMRRLPLLPSEIA